MMSEKLHKLSSSLSSPSISIEEKRRNLREINQDYLESEHHIAGGKSYISLEAHSRSCINGPRLECGTLRKGYTILAWINPSVLNNRKGNNNKKDECILFRLSNNKTIGVVASLSQIKHSNTGSFSWALKIQTFSSGDGGMSINPHPISSPIVEFSLPENTYSLLTISHSCPYIKHPQLSICVNHKMILQCDLAFPFSSSNADVHKSLMIYTTLFQNLPIKCCMLAFFKEAIIKDHGDDIFPNLLCEAGPSAFLHLVNVGVLVPPVPPHRDANVHSTSKTAFGERSPTSPNNSYGAQKSPSSTNASRILLGNPTAIHRSGVELQNFVSRSLISMYQFQNENVQIQDKQKRLLVTPCKVKRMGSLENSGWVIPKSQRRNPNLASYHEQSTSLKNILQIHSNVDYEHGPTLSIWIDLNVSKYHQSSSSNDSNKLIYTTGVLTSLLMPFHLALYPEDERDLFFRQKLKTPPFQPKLQFQREIHLFHLLSDNAQYAFELLKSISQILKISWFCREEALQTGLLHAVSTYTSKLLDQLVDKFEDPKTTTEGAKKSIEKGLLYIVQICCSACISENNKDVRFFDNPVRKTSDLALCCVFGLGLNYNILLHLSFNKNSSDILQHIVMTYSRDCGDIIREHYSVQTFLDQLRLYLSEAAFPSSCDLATQLEFLLSTLLKSSLTSHTFISRSEVDVQSCIHALTDKKLEDSISLIILRALSRVKSLRLARNMCLGEYLTVVGPVLLSRAIVGKENKTRQQGKDSSEQNNCEKDPIFIESWRLGFELYIWLTSVIGTDGEISAQNFGDLFFESAKTGSLYGCIDQNVANHIVGNDENILHEGTPHEFSFVFQEELPLDDTNRVQILIPLLPGIVTSLITPRHSSENDDIKELLIDSTLTTLLGGIILGLKNFVEPSTSTSETILANRNIFSPGNNQQYLDYDGTHLERTLKWIQYFITSVKILCNQESVQHSDWVDLEQSDNGVEAKEENHLTTCIKIALDCIATLLLVTMRMGALSTVKSLQLLRECPKLFQVLAMTLNKCTRNEPKSWSDLFSTGIARVCSFLEEKEKDQHQQQCRSNTNLLCALVEILKIGRDESGWYQTMNNCIPSPRNNVVGLQDDSGSTFRGKLTQFVDEAIIQTSSDIYHTLTTDDIQLNPSQHFHRGARVFLPILQPTLRILFRSLSQISSKTSFSSQRTLLQHVCDEINHTVTAALVGLSFPNARDVGLGCIGSLRKAIQNNPDPNAISLLENLLYQVLKEFSERHVIEKKLKHKTQYQSYGDGGKEVGENSKLVESLILGGDVVPQANSQNANDDFVLYPGSIEGDESFTSQGEKVSLGWSKYAGLSAALEKCSQNDQSTENILNILREYLDEWDALSLNEDEDKINLFDNSCADETEIEQKEVENRAGDIVAQFIELSSTEKLRLEEAQKIFFSLSDQCSASAAMLCWVHWMETSAPCEAELTEWERSYGERGGRDTYSRNGTCWIEPQFPKYIPNYLDHSTKNDTETTNDEILECEFNLGGKVEIVDITKKNITEGSLEESDEDEDAGSLGFPSKDSADEGDKSAEKAVQYNSVKKSNHQLNHHISSPFEFAYSHSRTVLSSFFHPPNVTVLHESSFFPGSYLEMYWDNILHISCEGSRSGALLITKTHLIIEYYNEFYEGELMAMEEARDRRMKANGDDEMSQGDSSEQELPTIQNLIQRPNSVRFLLSELTHAYLRRYRLRDSAFELFFLPSGGSSSFKVDNSMFIDFGPGAEGNHRRDAAASHIMKHAPQNSVKQLPEKSNRFLHEQLQKMNSAWARGSLTNFDYLMELNILSGRSFNDLCQYPVMPWVLSNYHSQEIPDLSDPDNFRDLSKPIGALNEKRLAEFTERFETFADPTIPPFMYGSHYSTSAGVVLHFLLRLHPYSGLHRQLQSGYFDVADRLFQSVQKTWEMCTGVSAAEVKELIPEFYSDPAFLRNKNKFKLGTSQEGCVLGDVVLPPWAKNNPEKFIEVMRAAMESNICSAMLPDWIDLIFGYKQQGPESIKANNVFFYLTYYGSVDLSSIPDEALRVATELQIAHFGQCPMQLFWRPHVKIIPLISKQRRDCLSYFLNLWSLDNIRARTLFQLSPINYWVVLAPPPPGPHADMVCIRLCMGNRCVGVDHKGIFHFFRWVWKPEDEESEMIENDPLSQYNGERGCFIAQRELSNFRSLPRLPYQKEIDDSSASDKIKRAETTVAIAISRQLHLSRSHLLILSDGDGCGGLGVQFVDPKRGAVKTETVIPCVHGSRITAISMDRIGPSNSKTSKGPSGEVAIVGSEDGSATLWRFIFNSCIPLRPRLRMRGHYGRKITAVGVNCQMNICTTVSKDRCCIFHLGNGVLMRSFGPPNSGDRDDISFADTHALCLSPQGFLVLVCETRSKNKDFDYSLELFTIEGVHCGSKRLDFCRGVPKKITALAEGKAVLVCSGYGVTIHKISTITPLDIIDEWKITDGTVPSQKDHHYLNRKIIYAHDIDLYPEERPLPELSTYKIPVCAAVACSNGIVRLHALPGITKWSMDNNQNSVSAAVGNALSKPASTLKNAVGSVKGFGSRFIGFGKEIGREVGGVISSGGVTSSVGGLLNKKR